jgi:hypothetical protein
MCCACQVISRIRGIVRILLGSFILSFNQNYDRHCKVACSPGEQSQPKQSPHNKMRFRNRLTSRHPQSYASARNDERPLHYKEFTPACFSYVTLRVGSLKWCFQLADCRPLSEFSSV